MLRGGGRYTYMESKSGASSGTYVKYSTVVAAYGKTSTNNLITE
jgi:hypothetical protein